jgi:hypothetical protein
LTGIKWIGIGMKKIHKFGSFLLQQLFSPFRIDGYRIQPSIFRWWWFGTTGFPPAGGGITYLHGVNTPARDVVAQLPI